MLNVVKWIGTILFCIGMTLNSFNIYPYNLFFSFAGGAIWTWIGWKTNDMALLWVDLFAVVIYVIGIIYYFVV